MKSLGARLTVIMLGIILVGIILTVSVSTIISGNTIIKESINTQMYATMFHATEMDEWISSQMAMVAATGSAVSNAESLAPDELRTTLASVLNANNSLLNVYFGFPDNTAVMGNGYPIENDYATWKATERGWYKQALSDTGKAHVTPLYIDVTTGDFCVTFSKAVLNNGRIIGVLGVDILIDSLRKLLPQAESDSAARSMLLDSSGSIMIHPNPEYAPNEKGEFKNLGTTNNGVYADLWQSASASDGVYKHKDSAGQQCYFMVSRLKTPGWLLITVLPSGVITKPIVNVVAIVIAIAIAVLLIAATMIFIIIRNTISRPLAPITEFMTKAGTTGCLALSDDEKAGLAALSSRKDEIGQLSHSATTFFNHVSRVSDMLAAVSNGDLSQSLELLSPQDTMGIAIRQMSVNLNEMFGQLNDSAALVSSSSAQIADGSQNLAQGSTEQAASIEALSSAIYDITEKTKVNANMAGKAASLAQSIKSNAERGSLQMEEMLAAVNDINAASSQISKVISVIDDIAFQTNILALNAAVEAARAGQHGKGFAVVAEEVRNLAGKSAEAARDTSSMIENSIAKANLGVSIARETSVSLEDIVSGINESNQIVINIASSSEEQAASISHINTGIEQVAQVVQQNTATAEEEAATAQELSSQSLLMSELISRFKLRTT